MLFKSLRIGAFLLFASQEVAGKHNEFQVSNCHAVSQKDPIFSKHETRPKSKMASHFDSFAAHMFPFVLFRFSKVTKSAMTTLLLCPTLILIKKICPITLIGEMSTDIRT